LFALPEAVDFRERCRKKGWKVVFTNGCFDILHAGHVLYLTEVRSLGDVVIVGLNSDVSVKRIKGKERPITPEKERGLVLAGLEAVDKIVTFDDETPIPILEALKPDVHAKGGDYQAEKLPEYPIIKTWGGEVKILSFYTGFSTSALIEKIRQLS